MAENKAIAGRRVLVAVALLYRRNVRLTARPQWGALRGLARVTAGNSWLNISLIAPIQLTPILVTGLLPAAEDHRRVLAVLTYLRQ